MSNSAADHYECVGQMEVTIRASTPQEAAEAFVLMAGHPPDQVGDHSLLGMCDECGGPILDDHPGQWDIHEECPSGRGAEAVSALISLLNIFEEISELIDDDTQVAHTIAYLMQKLGTPFEEVAAAYLNQVVKKPARPEFDQLITSIERRATELSQRQRLIVSRNLRALARRLRGTEQNK